MILLFTYFSTYFSLPDYALIGLVSIPLLFQDSVSVNLTMGRSFSHKVSIVQPLLST